MEADQLDDAIQALRDDLTRTHDDLTREVDERKALLRRLDELSGKLRYPGTQFLVDLEYKLVLDTTITAAASTLTASAVFETLPGTLHALYHVSAYAPSSNTPVLITDGSIVVAPTGAITVGVVRQRASSPLRIESSVAVYNAIAAPHDVAVRVWRRLGMGS